MDGIDLSEVSKTYNTINKIWDINDKWHWVTHQMIKSFISESLKNIPNSYLFKVLNAGSAGNNYELIETNTIHLDIAKNKIADLTNAILSSIEDIPVRNESFDLIVCVGSVINYCDPIRVFQEFNRLLKSPGYIILEFETSRTLELFGKKDFNKNLVLTDTFYNGGTERLWYYSEKFIKEIALNNDLRVLAEDRCHIISPLVYRMLKDEIIAARFAKYDKIFLKVPVINTMASNVIYLFHK